MAAFLLFLAAWELVFTVWLSFLPVPFSAGANGGGSFNQGTGLGVLSAGFLFQMVRWEQQPE